MSLLCNFKFSSSCILKSKQWQVKLSLVTYLTQYLKCYSTQNRYIKCYQFYITFIPSLENPECVLRLEPTSIWTSHVRVWHWTEQFWRGTEVEIQTQCWRFLTEWLSFHHLKDGDKSYPAKLLLWETAILCLAHSRLLTIECHYYINYLNDWIVQ